MLDDDAPFLLILAVSKTQTHTQTTPASSSLWSAFLRYYHLNAKTYSRRARRMAIERRRVRKTLNISWLLELCSMALCVCVCAAASALRTTGAFRLYKCIFRATDMRNLPLQCNFHLVSFQILISCTKLMSLGIRRCTHTARHTIQPCIIESIMELESFRPWSDVMIYILGIQWDRQPMKELGTGGARCRLIQTKTEKRQTKREVSLNRMERDIKYTGKLCDLPRSKAECGHFSMRNCRMHFGKFSVQQFGARLKWNSIFTRNCLFRSFPMLMVSVHARNIVAHKPRTQPDTTCFGENLSTFCEWNDS